MKPGRYWLVADAPGYAGGRSEEIVIPQGERREGVEIKLVRGATIKGRVLDAKGGPVANATVQPDPASLTGNGAAGIFLAVLMQNMRRDIREAKTDAEGRYSIPNMLSGSYTLTVRASRTTVRRRRPRSWSRTRATSASPTSVMSRGATIKGRVKLPDGAAGHEGDGADRAGRRRRRTSRDTGAPTPTRTGGSRSPGSRSASTGSCVAQRNGQPDSRDALHRAEEPEPLHALRGRGEGSRPLTSDLLRAGL